MINKLDTKLIDYYENFKKTKDDFLCTILTPFARLGIVADVVSLCGLVSGLLSAVFLHYSRLLFIIFWLGKRIADIIDGPISKLNQTKIFKRIDVDHFCDITFSLALFASPFTFLGIFWPFLAITTHIVHILFDFNLMGKTLLAPSNYAQFFYLFGYFKEGLIFQVIYTIFAFSYLRIANIKVRN